MDDMFRGQTPEGELPDLHFYIFPHLQEFLVVDLRGEEPQVTSLNASEVLGGEFYRAVEGEFSHVLRHATPYPFDHLINLPLHLEEIVREVAMTSILESLGIDPEDQEHFPTAMVFVVSGAVVSMHRQELLQSFRTMIGGASAHPNLEAWEANFSHLLSQEREAVERLSRQELTEAMSGDSPDYFSLWENRN